MRGKKVTPALAWPDTLWLPLSPTGSPLAGQRAESPQRASRLCPCLVWIRLFPAVAVFSRFHGPSISGACKEKEIWTGLCFHAGHSLPSASTLSAQSLGPGQVHLNPAPK